MGTIEGFYPIASRVLPTRIMLTTTCIICFIIYGYKQNVLANIEVTELFRSQFGYSGKSLLGIIVQYTTLNVLVSV